MSITAHIMGGCGNQLFQFAAAQAAALRLGTDVRLYITGYDDVVPDGHWKDWRVYSLGLFRGITAPTCRDYQGARICENGLPYNAALAAQITDPCTLIGYFQTEKWFAETRPLLKSQILPKQDLVPYAHDIARQIRAEGDKSAFITIRRTDYVTTDYHGLLPMEYYKNAAALIAEKVSDPCFFVFSDEPAWVKSHFRLPYRTVVAGNYDRSVRPHLGREDSELFLMSLCRHAIMANSSYSWWGAWLGTEEGIIIGPKKWFGTATEDPRDIMPDRWIKL